MSVDYSIVIPTIGRKALQHWLFALDGESRTVDAPRPARVILVDDRPGRPSPLGVTMAGLPVTTLRSGGRGPAAARNVGWRAARTEWVCFLDDDVVPQPGWLRAVAEDLRDAQEAGAVGSQGAIEVPRPSHRRSTDDERRTEQLAHAQWITADMAYRRRALVTAGGFDERFTRAYREDADLALRLTRGGGSIVLGARRSVHPVAPSTLLSSVHAQVGNRDNALMRRKHGPGWRSAVGEGPGRLGAHLVTTAAAASALAGLMIRRPVLAGLGASAWAALTAQFALQRFMAGPRTVDQAARLALTSALIPPVAVAHRAVGEWTWRRARPDPPLAVLLDRDDTLIEDGPYLRDPDRVRPVRGARRAVDRLRAHGLLLAVVTNQSGVAKGLIRPEELDAVNARVDAVLGPFDSWQICVHDDGDGCGCRKPAAGMVFAAAEALGVDAARCVVIGDTGADVSAALAAGADAVLVPTARTLAREIVEARARARVAASLEDAVAMVLQECR